MIPAVVVGVRHLRPNHFHDPRSCLHEAPRKEIDKFFSMIDEDDSGFIEFGEMKEALKERNAKQATSDRKNSR